MTAIVQLSYRSVATQQKEAPQTPCHTLLPLQQSMRPLLVAALAIQASALDPLAARLAAHKVLRETGKETPAALLARHTTRLDEREKRFAADLVEKCHRHASEIDALLDEACEKRPRGSTLHVLRLGVAQLLYFDSIPNRAAVDTSVQLCKKRGGNPGLTNAVLRRLSREAPSVEQAKPPLYDLLVQDRGAELADRYLEACTKPPAMLQVTCASSEKRDELIEAVDGVAQSFGEFGAALRPEKRTPVPALPLFDEGVWWAQDAGAMQAALLLKSLPKGAKVLDMCSAPGGKALQLSSFGFDVVAVEKSANRAKRLRQNLERCKCDVDVRVQDATLINDMFDGVLVDAPCSATGTARRRPDVLRKELDLEALAATQAALLDAAWRCLKPGGLLVFSSCSALTADAEQSFAAFLRRTADADGVEVAAAELGFVDDESVVDGALRLWPWHVAGDAGGCDAHYAARARKGPG